MHVSYREYTLVLGMSILAKALVMPFAAQFANKYGVRALLILSGVIMIPLPAMWLCSREVWFLMGIQTVAGMSWGGFELAIMLIFIETIPGESRTNVLTLYNLGYALASVLGSLLGGWMLATFGTSTTGLLCRVRAVRNRPALYAAAGDDAPRLATSESEPKSSSPRTPRSNRRSDRRRWIECEPFQRNGMLVIFATDLTD